MTWIFSPLCFDNEWAQNHLMMHGIKETGQPEIFNKTLVMLGIVALTVACRGPAGEAGEAGDMGAMGAMGAEGPAGPAGLACWDLDSNGSCDTGNEDVNMDGVCDALDCQGDTRLLYSRLMTASWLENNAEFGSSREHTLTDDVSGQALTFTAGSMPTEKLFEVPLMPAGSLSAQHSYLVKVRVWVQVSGIAQEDDLIVGLTDGVNVVGFFRLDTSNGAFGYLVSALDGDGVIADRSQDTNAVISSIPHHTYEVHYLLGDRTETAVVGDSDTLPVVGTHNAIIDRTQALALVGVADEALEQYVLRAIRVEIYREG